jgi:hypothetical protein
MRGQGKGVRRKTQDERSGVVCREAEGRSRGKLRSPGLAFIHLRTRNYKLEIDSPFQVVLL